MNKIIILYTNTIQFTPLKYNSHNLIEIKSSNKLLNSLHEYK